MRVKLIDVDSTIPNLALMKLSAYHKAKGDEVGFNIEDPEKVYASIIFKKNRYKADGLRFYYPDAEIDVGGSGYDLYKRIPEEAELLCPDYSLYEGMDFDLGFTSRGCDRGCYFCIVTRKEGPYRRAQHPSEFHDPSHKKVMLLDNNILNCIFICCAR